MMVAVLSAEEVEEHYISLRRLQGKSDRESPPPPYEDPPSYNMAITVELPPPYVLSPSILV